MVPGTAFAAVSYSYDFGYDKLSNFEPSPNSEREKLFSCLEEKYLITIGDAREYKEEATKIRTANAGLYSGPSYVMPEEMWMKHLEKLTDEYCSQFSYLFEINSKPSEINSSPIPSWIKNNAKWWADGSIYDDTFVQGIEFLIKEKIIEISSTTSQKYSHSKEIPSWIKNNAAWWAEGQIDDDSFFKGIEFLVSNGIIRIDEQILTGKIDGFAKISNLDQIRPRQNADDIWDSHRIVSNTQAPDDSEDDLRMWYMKNDDMVQFYIYQFPNNDIAQRYYQNYLSLIQPMYAEIRLEPHTINLEPQNHEEECFEDQALMPNGYPKGTRHDYLAGIICISNNIVFHSYHHSDDFNSPNYTLTSGSSILTKINQVLGYDEPKVELSLLSNLSASSDSFQFQDSTTYGDSFEIDVVSCEPTSGGHYIEVAYGIKNNLPDDYQLDLQILLLDNNGDVIEIKRTYADTKAGRTIYDDRLLDYDPRTVQCFIEIVDGFVPYN